MGKVNIISSGSRGNAVLYGDNRILVDCGVSYAKIKPYSQQTSIVLLTHTHGDHLSLATLRQLQFERPSVRIGCCEWMLPLLQGLNNIDVYEIGKVYNYGVFKVSPFKLYHDVENCGYRIYLDDCKIFHATDTAHLEGITAKGYDVYAIEANYDEEKVEEAMRIAAERGEFCHAYGSVQSHLSWQNARRFFEYNKKDDSELIELHKSTTYY